jgi:hypothetical protein
MDDVGLPDAGVGFRREAQGPVKPLGEHHPLRRFFRGLVENVFAAELGLCNPTLADYLADLLTGFIHIDRLRAIRDAEGKPLDQIADMLALVVRAEQGETPGANRTCTIYRHIGDFSLFWTGVYPESLRRRRALPTKDRLLDYVQQGKRSYALASELTREDSIPPPRLLRHLSEHFEACVHGLGRVRTEWEHESPHTLAQAARILY